MVRAVIRPESAGAYSIWKSHGVEPRRGRGCPAGNLHSAPGLERRAGATGSLVCTELPQPRFELPTVTLAAVYSGP